MSRAKWNGGAQFGQHDCETLATRTYLDACDRARPLSDPICRGTVFEAPDLASLAQNYRGKEGEFYQRFGHPDENRLASKVAALEGGQSCAVFASGMAAVSTALLAHAAPGSHVIAGKQIFEQTEAILNWMAEGRGVKVSFVDTQSVGAIEAAIRAETRIIYIESPSNPHLTISDISAIAQLADENEALLFVDSTFATPVAQRPLALGASISLHSGTKFLNGHMDAMSGLAIGSETVIAPVRQLKQLLGGVLDPQASWLVQRGIKTLDVRMKKIFENALRIAAHLEASPQVAEVNYPFLKSHPGFEIAQKQMSGGGGVISFRLRGGKPAAVEFVDRLDLIHIASSLGGVESVIEIPGDLDWSSDSGVDNPSIEPGLIRLSIGIESADDLIADIDQSLARLTKPHCDPEPMAAHGQ